MKILANIAGKIPAKVKPFSDQRNVSCVDGFEALKVDSNNQVDSLIGLARGNDLLSKHLTQQTVLADSR